MLQIDFEIADVKNFKNNHKLVLGTKEIKMIRNTVEFFLDDLTPHVLDSRNYILNFF